MTQDEIRQALGALDGVQLLIGAPEAGTPEAAYGDTFCTYAPDDGTAPDKLPFATIVTHDTPGWDEASGLDRPGAFRVNLAVGRSHVPEVVPDVDHAREDVLLPHPQYATQGWVAMVNPTDATRGELRTLIERAYLRARDRHHRSWPASMISVERRRAQVSDERTHAVRGRPGPSAGTR